MLVLTRKLGEKIRIGEEIEVEVLDVRGNRIRLGISCPVEIPIRRAELEPEQLSAPVKQVAANHVCEFQYAGI